MKIIPLKDYNLLERLLGMTASDSDAEALTAIRKANKILKEHSFTWPELLRKVVASVPSSDVGYDGEEPYETDSYDRFNDAPKRSTGMTVDEAFAFMRGKDVGEFLIFLTSIEKFYREKRFLTGKQKAALFKAVHSEQKRAGT